MANRIVCVLAETYVLKIYAIMLLPSDFSVAHCYFYIKSLKINPFFWSPVTVFQTFKQSTYSKRNQITVKDGMNRIDNILYKTDLKLKFPVKYYLTEEKKKSARSISLPLP